LPACWLKKFPEFPSGAKLIGATARAGENVGVELLEAERRFEHGFAVDDPASFTRQQEAALLKVRCHFLMV